MGLTGVASADDVGAAPHNPAGLASIDKQSLQITATPGLFSLSAPFHNRTGQPVSREASSSLTLLGMLAGAQRVHERVVVGAAALLTTVSGASFKDVPELEGANINVGAFAGEVQIPVAIRLLDNLSVGVAYRVGLAAMRAQAPMTVGPYSGAGKIGVSGKNFAGFQLGVRYQPVSNLDLGLSYRNRTVTELKGDTQLNGSVFQTKTNLTQPDELVAGAALSMLESKLVLTLDLKAWLYGNAKEAEGWDNSFAIGLGAEYWVARHIPLRAGLFAAKSAIGEEAANPFSQTPGTMYSAAIGSGLKIDYVTFDLSLGLRGGSGTVKQGYANPGDYSFSVPYASLSATYQL